MGIKIEKAKTGGLTFKFNDRYFHSKIDPLKEASRLIQNYDLTRPCVVLLKGTGFGYTLLELLKYPNVKIITPAPFEELNEPYLNAGKNKNLLLVKTKQDIEKIEDFIGAFENYKSIIKFKDDKWLLINEFNALYSLIESKIDEIISFTATVKNFKSSWQTNIKNNFSQKFKDVLCLKEKFTDKNVVCAAGGPTLDLNLNKIQGGIIFAADTATRTLILNNIKPDIIMSIDPQEISANHFKDIKDFIRDIPLVTEILVTPAVLSFFKEKYLFYSANPYAENKFNVFELKNKGGCVLTAMAALAKEFKAKSISFFGADFCFYNDMTHTKGSFYFEETLKKQTKMSGLLTEEYKKCLLSGKKMFYKNKTRKTGANLILYKKQLKEILHAPPRAIFSGVEYD